MPSITLRSGRIPARAHALAEKLIEFMETGEVPDGLFAADMFCDFTMPTWGVVNLCLAATLSAARRRGAWQALVAARCAASPDLPAVAFTSDYSRRRPASDLPAKVARLATFCNLLRWQPGVGVG